jgi:hypothetical protein
MQDAFMPHYLVDAVRQFHSLKSLAEGALAQLDDHDLFITLDEEANSIAVLLKHMAGSMHTHAGPVFPPQSRTRKAAIGTANSRRPRRIPKRC